MKNICVSEEIHTKAKTFAASRQQSLQEFAEAAISEKIAREGAQTA